MNDNLSDHLRAVANNPALKLLSGLHHDLEALRTLIDFTVHRIEYTEPEDLAEIGGDLCVMLYLARNKADAITATAEELAPAISGFAEN